MKDLLTIASGAAPTRLWVPAFVKALEEFGGVTIVEQGKAMSDDDRAALIRQYRVLLTGWGSSSVPESLAQDCGRLEYICNVTGSVRRFIPLAIIEAGIPVTNWGPAAAVPVAEAAMALLLTVAKNMRARIEAVASGAYAPGKPAPTLYSYQLKNMPVGVYGCGAIGRQFIELLRPWDCVIRVYDPFVLELPSDCQRVDTLDDLFATSRAIVIHAGLCDQTAQTVTAARLAKLADHSIIINTARGDIIDQSALFAELETGRLGAGLDVLALPEPLPSDHPARRWPNLVWTGHTLAQEHLPGDENRLREMHMICLDNLRRHWNGQPLRFVVDRDRYLRST